MKQPDYTENKYFHYKGNEYKYDHYFKVINNDTVLMISFGRSKKKGVSRKTSMPHIHFIKLITFETNWNFYSKVFKKRICVPVSKKEFKEAFKKFNETILKHK